MNRILLCLALLVFFAPDSDAKKIDLECDALDYRVESQLNLPLQEGSVRSATYSIAGFLNADSYALKVTIQCEGKAEEKVCIAISDSNYCPNPQASFRIRSVGGSDQNLMVKNRCTGEWAKYSKISSIGTTQNYLHDEVAFQLKNQIYSGINIADKPILSLHERSEDGVVAIKVASFTRDLWRVNEFDPLVGILKVNPENYEKDEHRRVTLNGKSAQRNK